MAAAVVSRQVYISVWMPWPLNDIAFMVEANGADLLDEEGCLLICFQTPDRKVLGPDAPPPDSEKHRQMRLLAPSCMSFEPLPPKTPGGPPRAQCVVQTYVDANVRIVPPFIIAFVLKVLSPFVYAAVLKVLSSAFKSPDNPLPKRIKQRPELYGLIRRRTEAYLKSKAAADQAFKGTSAAVAPAGGRDHHS
ncbi:hypothetical protein Vafri_5366 [Volvox africanus]|nr:hypothetical protein Vafri_5366 [Volvox africanus]